MDSERGFTLLELVIAVAIAGILAAVAVPGYHAMTDRVRGAATLENMHAFRVAVEGCAAASDSGTYPGSAAEVAAQLAPGFANPFDGGQGEHRAWEDLGPRSASARPHPGIVRYASSDGGAGYEISAWGAHAPVGGTLNAPPAPGAGAGGGAKSGPGRGRHGPAATR